MSQAEISTLTASKPKRPGRRPSAKPLALVSPVAGGQLPHRTGLLNAFTVDVEDYYHVEAFADRIAPADWPSFPSRVVANTHRILAILAEYDVRATFFVLGWVADRFPQFIWEIQSAGHEIGCHSYAHRLIYRMTPEEFRADLRRATDTIENVTGRRVAAFRAPSFSITAESLWALDVLIEAGYRYDSSIFPIHHDKYGIPAAPRSPYVIRSRAESRESRAKAPNSPQPAAPRGDAPNCSPALDSRLALDSQPSTLNSLWEFPPSVARVCGCNVPIAGGGYFRLYPAGLTLRLLARINRRDHRPFLFYIHPWELDPDQPRLPCGLRSRFRHYQNLPTTERKLRRLLATFRFGTMSQSLEEAHDE